jgi:hypothetical protein
MRPIEHLLIVAGATASGKSALIREIRAGRLPELHTRLGVENPQQWPCASAHFIERWAVAEPNELILEYDFLWHNLDGKEPAGESASSVLERAREVSFVTLWTPPARLEKQFINGRLRASIPPNRGGILRAAIFRLLPRFIIRALSRLAFLEQINRRLPGTVLLRGLLVVKIYSRPEQVLALYRRWFQFCDEHSSKMRGHLIVEYDTELKIYSRDEWESRIRTDEGGGLT